MHAYYLKFQHRSLTGGSEQHMPAWLLCVHCMVYRLEQLLRAKVRPAYCQVHARDLFHGRASLETSLRSSTSVNSYDTSLTDRPEETEKKLHNNEGTVSSPWHLTETSHEDSENMVAFKVWARPECALCSILYV